MKLSPALALGLTILFSVASIPTTTFPDEAEQKAYRVAPIRRPPGHEERKIEAAAQAAAIESGRLAPPLEEEAAIKPTPRRPVVMSGFVGMNFNDTPGFVPPDTHAATGPDHIVETVNTTVTFFNRSSGTIASGPQDLSVFFSSVGASTNLTDPVVAYDELAGRFFIGVLDFGTAPNESYLLYAVSDTSDPTAGFTEMHSISLAEPAQNCAGPATVLGDFTRVGWNADAHVFTFNMFDFSTDCYDHATIVTIDKSTVLDASNGTFTFYHADRDNTHFSLAPATMHGSTTGDPMWFVEETTYGGGSQIRVTKMTDILSNVPTFTPTDVTVSAYGFPPNATQKGGGALIDVGDARLLNTEWRSNRLVATHTVGLSGAARARWYEFDTSGTPTLTQQGTINQGVGVHTYYPSIAIAPNGDMGMTFMQSSSTQYMSMYVTGRLPADPPGTMQSPVLAKAGLANYRAFDCFSGGHFTKPCRAGDFSGITVDPDTNNTFCAANEYARSLTPATSANWGTWITCFRIGVHDLAVTSISAPVTVTGIGPVTGAVKVTIQNRSDHNETVISSDLGNGNSSGLVRLAVNVIDNGSESCNPAIVVLASASNNPLFIKGPKVLTPRANLTVNFLVTYHCPNAVSKIKSAAGDYSHTATVYHEDLDGNADQHTPDDICPHNSLFDPNPPTTGTKDPGCGAKKTKTTFGNPVVTNVVP